mmetsp:Transcript_68172/g.199468  ORF Transcript_68172/g.199468 Transcript_68172/m.199468 type:complete len:395 (-) Transcript_68172:16-1200(-)
MASHCTAVGLRAAVLNAAVVRCLAGGLPERARAVLQSMAKDALWTPVTYRLAERLDASGAGGPRLEGRPAFPGLVDPGPGAHKYVRAVYHAFKRASPGDLESVLAGLEHFSQKRGWLKFGAADEKGGVIDDALRRLVRQGKQPVTVEFGTFLGYATLRMARSLGPGARIVSFELDPEVACLAMNVIEFAGVDADISVWVGGCQDLAPRLGRELGPGSVGFVYMDHNQITYHEDLAQLEALGMLADGAVLAATQGLKPGAPLLLWRLAEAQKAGRCKLEVVSSPDCGCPMMEDWVVLAEFHVPEVDGAGADVGGAATGWAPPDPPYELALLAAECNLMRWRTAKGLVNEQRWNGFVQYVRQGMARIAGITSDRDVWPDQAIRDKARSLPYKRLDY